MDVFKLLYMVSAVSRQIWFSYKLVPTQLYQASNQPIRAKFKFNKKHQLLDIFETLVGFSFIVPNYELARRISKHPWNEKSVSSLKTPKHWKM